MNRNISQFELAPSQVRDIARHSPELLQPVAERGALKGTEAEYVKGLISKAMDYEDDFSKLLFSEVEGVGAVSFSICYLSEHRNEPGINVIFEGVDGDRQLLGYVDLAVEGNTEEVTVCGAQSTDPDDLEYIGPEDDLWDPVVGELARAIERLESEKNN
ncbi:hypothetical protein HGB25_02790 [Candidatus Saccharibacteria bacterium]|nr:hypothetical protein [Candidatus Saccharibacteria bacterium]